MLCRHCGTEIADKAIICFRCGKSTTDPVRRPATVRPRRSRLFELVALVVLVLLGLFLGQAGPTVVPEGYRLGVVYGIVLAIVLLVVRIVRRR
jgi:hypothetical protein